jgi:acyl carrier protein
LDSIGEQFGRGAPQEYMELTTERVLEFMGEHLGLDTAGVDAETPLFSSGFMDSASLVDLIVFIESLSHVTFQPEDVTLDNLDSIGRMLAFVAARTAEG